MTASVRQDPSTSGGDDAFAIYRRTGDRDLRDALVRRHLGLAESLAERYTGRGVARADLRQVAAMGLIKAVDRFDPARGVAFTSFAVPTILGELRRHFRDAGWTIRVPRRLQELRHHADVAAAQLEQRLQRRPTLAETAAELDEDPENVLLALDGLRTCYRPAPLDPRTAQGAEAHHRDDPSAHAATAIVLRDLIAQLPRRQQQIVVLRYWGGLTQQEIADRVGISQMHVSRLLRSGLRHLRDTAQREGVSDGEQMGMLVP